MSPPRKASSSRSSQAKEAAPLSLDYEQLWRLCLKYWKYLVGGVAVGILAGLFYTAFQTSIYEAKATIVVQAKDASVPAGGDVGLPDTKSGDLLKTFEQLLQMKNLVARVVKSEHLNENPDFLPPSVTAVSEETATGMLAGDVSIKIRPFTRLIEIKVDHRSPQMAQMLANKLAEESILQEFDQKSVGASALSDYLQTEVDRLQKKVAESEHALQDYQAAHKDDGGILDDNEDLGVTRVKDLNQQYINAQAQLTLLKERYGPEHPKLIQQEAEVAELRNEVGKAQEDVVKSSGPNIGYKTLKSVAESYRAQLNNMLKALNEAQAAVHIEIPGISIADPAEAYGPVSPDRTKAAGVGGFIGLLCGLGFIFGLYFVDTSLRTVSQAESVLGIPVIGAVPILKASDGSTILPTYSDPQSFVAESFRGIRASLILHDREHPLKTILMVSAIPGEGKSFCGANLAVAFAQAGLKTLLIDADLRLPTLHTYFDLPGNEESSGFPDVLSGRSTLASAIVPSAIPTLSLLLTTNAVPSPAELLSGIRLPLLLDEAAQKYDRVVVDSAPLNAVSDTMLIMQKADAILQVVRAAQTPASECKGALQKMESSQMKPLGIILNYIDPHTLKSYAYGYSYGQKPKEKNAI